MARTKRAAAGASDHGEWRQRGRGEVLGGGKRSGAHGGCEGELGAAGEELGAPDLSSEMSMAGGEFLRLSSSPLVKSSN